MICVNDFKIYTLVFLSLFLGLLEQKLLLNLELLKGRRKELLHRRVWIQTREQQLRTKQLGRVIKIFKLLFKCKIIL